MKKTLNIFVFLLLPARLMLNAISAPGKKKIAILLAAVIYLFAADSVAVAQTTSFTTPGTYTYTVSPGTISLQISAAGAKGGDAGGSSVMAPGGYGGSVVCTLAVYGGEVLNIAVGGGDPTSSGVGGFNGGGYGASGSGATGSGGGGSSDIRIGGTDLANRVIVAAGGSGCSVGILDVSNGAAGGGLSGDGGDPGSTEGGGGTQSAGGTAGRGYVSGTFGGSGVLGVGGNAIEGGGGGGGGYYGGGGGGYYSPGGGGSSYYGGSGVTGASTASGTNGGDGYITITTLCTVNAGTIGGTFSLCAGNSSTLSESIGGGTWSSSTPGVASVNSSGMVLGVSAGTTIISYSVTSGCGTASATSIVTVNPLPDAGTITGLGAVCVGAAITLTDAASGGSWSADGSGNGSVDVSGNVTGIMAGTVTIFYTATTPGCGTAMVSAIVTVNAVPAAITGTANVCAGSTISLTDATTGGVWSVDSSGHATVSGGIVTGVSAGTAAISYTDAPACYKTITVTVNQSPSAITGTGAVCAAATLTLTATWTSEGAPTVFNVTGAPQVYIVPAGAYEVNVTLTGGQGGAGTATSGGNGGTTTATIAVTPGQVLNVFVGDGGTNHDGSGGTSYNGGGVMGSVYGTGAGGGASDIRIGGTDLSNRVIVAGGGGGGGFEESLNGGAGGGLIGMSGGFAFGATAATGGTQTAGGTGGIPPSSFPHGISGNNGSLGQGGNMLAGAGGGAGGGGYYGGGSGDNYDEGGGGGGSSYADPAVTSDAVMTQGTNTSYTGMVTIIPLITNAGIWTSSSSNATVVGSTGVVSGVTAGTATISFTIADGCNSTAVVTVNPSPVTGSTGGGAICLGDMATLSGTGASSYSWTGGITDGVAFTPSVGVNTYTVTGTTGSCSNTATATITVNALPTAGTSGGGIAICSGATATLSGTGATSYSWSGGISDGIAFTPAVGVNIYTVTGTNSCGSSTATATITVNALPTVGTSGGGIAICSVATATLSGTGATSYSWTGGVTDGVSFTPTAGTHSYTVTGTTAGCSNTATTTLTVNVTNPGTISGPSSVTAGANITLTDALGGGTWSASNSHATVTGGVVNGVSAGTVTISYSVSGSCGTAAATKLVTVGSGTVTVSAIAETQSYVCIGSTDLMMDYSPGGTWSIAPTSVATISATGVVSGVSAGTATVTYTIGGSFATALVTVYPAPAVITGSPGVCQAGGTTLLADATPGGVWSSTIPSTASIGAGTGLVTGTNPGTVTMYYTIASPGGCRAAVVVTVNPNPSAISGPVKVCTGSAIALSNAIAGGAWSGTNAHASIDAFGNVAGLTAGTVIFTYTTGASCFKTVTITVNQAPAPISGNLVVCAGSKTYLSDAVTPAVSWTSGTASAATITASGAVTGVMAGTTVITCTPSGLCTITAVVTVNPTPAITSILGASIVSRTGSGITLSDLTGGGLWSSSNTAIVTVGSTTGHVTAIAAGGSADINYVITNGFGCVNSVSKLIGASAAPHTQANSATTTVGATVNIADEAMGGEWTSSDSSVAMVDANGIVSGITPGITTITHTSTGDDGAVTTSVTQLIVEALPFTVRVVPNPNNGAFSVTGAVGSGKEEPVELKIMNMLGQVIYSNTVTAPGGKISEAVTLNNTLANGMYMLNIHTGAADKTFHFVVEK